MENPSRQNNPRVGGGMYNGNTNNIPTNYNWSDWLPEEYQDVSNGYTLWDKWFNPSKVDAYQNAMAMRQKAYDAWYNSAQTQMAMQTDAGVNPNLAAGNVGSSQVSGGAPAPSGAGESLSDMVGTAAEATRDVVDSKSVAEKLPGEKNLINSNIFLNLMNGGLAKWNSLSVAAALPYTRAIAIADFMLKLGQANKLQGEYDLLLDEHKANKRRFKLLGQEIEKNAQNLTEGELNLAIAENNKKMSDNDLFFSNSVTNLYRKYHMNPEWTLDQNLISLIGNQDKVGLKALQDGIMKYYEEEAYAKQKGSSRAEFMFGSAKNPWELGDKYVNRLYQWIHGNGADNPDIENEQILNLIDSYMIQYPDKTRDDAVKELYRIGFTPDEVVRALKSKDKD